MKENNGGMRPTGDVKKEDYYRDRKKKTKQNKRGGVHTCARATTTRHKLATRHVRAKVISTCFGLGLPLHVASLYSFSLISLSFLKKKYNLLFSFTKKNHRYVRYMFLFVFNFQT